MKVYSCRMMIWLDAAKDNNRKVIEIMHAIAVHTGFSGFAITDSINLLISLLRDNSSYLENTDQSKPLE